LTARLTVENHSLPKPFEADAGPEDAATGVAVIVYVLAASEHVAGPVTPPTPPAGAPPEVAAPPAAGAPPGAVPPTEDAPPDEAPLAAVPPLAGAVPPLADLPPAVVDAPPMPASPPATDALPELPMASPSPTAPLQAARPMGSAPASQTPSLRHAASPRGFGLEISARET
jgi:hypothetical protein